MLPDCSRLGELSIKARGSREPASRYRQTTSENGSLRKSKPERQQTEELSQQDLERKNRCRTIIAQGALTGSINRAALLTTLTISLDLLTQGMYAGPSTLEQRDFLVHPEQETKGKENGTRLAMAEPHKL